MKVATNRLEAFSDGVIAIIITVMVLQFRLPNLTSDADATSRQILAHLHTLIPYFAAYAFSFMIIGISWTNHHQLFHLLEHTDVTLLWQNFLLLFFMSLIPFTTAVVSANPHLSISVSLYAAVLACHSACFYLMRKYTLKRQLLHHDENSELNREIIKVSRKARKKSLAAVCLYGGAALLAWVNEYLAYACLVVPPIIFFIPDGIDNEELAEQVAEKK